MTKYLLYKETTMHFEIHQLFWAFLPYDKKKTKSIFLFLLMFLSRNLSLRFSFRILCSSVEGGLKMRLIGKPHVDRPVSWHLDFIKKNPCSCLLKTIPVYLCGHGIIIKTTSFYYQTCPNTDDIIPICF